MKSRNTLLSSVRRFVSALFGVSRCQFVSSHALYERFFIPSVGRPMASCSSCADRDVSYQVDAETQTMLKLPKR